MRHRTRARRGDGIPPTKYRAADGGCSAREASSFSPKGETNACDISPAPEGAMRGFVLGRSRYPPKRSGVAEGDVSQGCGTLLGEADCTGLDPEAVYVGLHRTRPRSRICIRRAGRRTGKAPASKGEHGCPKQSRTLEGKPGLNRARAEPADVASLIPSASTCRTSSTGCRLRPCRSSRRGSSSRGRARR